MRMFSKSQYRNALLSLENQLTLRQLDIFRIHFGAANRTLTATELTKSLGLRRFNSANSAYGNLARKMGKSLGLTRKPKLGDEAFWFPVLAKGKRRNGEYTWIMRQALANALVELGWFDETGQRKQVSSTVQVFMEGAAYSVTLNVYERNRKARTECIARHGSRCSACEMTLEEVYGTIGRNVIEVHHIAPVSQQGGPYVVDPAKDLCPVCPNCHAIIHRRNPPFGIDEVRAMLALSRAQSKQRRDS